MITGRHEYTDDVLREYINPENTEQAPEGFASRVMTNIRMEPVRLAGKRNRIPYVSSAIIILLVIIAALTPGKELVMPDIFSKVNFPGNIKIPANFSEELLKVHVPAVLVYVVAATVLLTAFDGILISKLFRRRKN